MKDDSGSSSHDGAAAQNLARLRDLVELAREVAASGREILSSDRPPPPGPHGLVLAAIACATVGTPSRGLPPEGSTAAAIALLPGITVWAWATAKGPEVVAHDLAAARALFGEGTRAVVVLRPRAKVVRLPREGEVGAAVSGVDAVSLLRAVGALSEDALVRGVDLPWSETAEKAVVDAGFAAPEEAP